MFDDIIVLGKDLENGELVGIDAETSQRILVCGKTGTGKSYTLGVIIEELANMGSSTILVIDPQGIFWTMAQANDVSEEVDALWEHDRSARGFPINLMVPGSPAERFGDREIVEEMERRGIHVQSLRLNPADLTPEMWCDLFDLDINELKGIHLFKAVRQCAKRLGRDFFIDDIAAEVNRIKALDQTKEAVQRRLDMAYDWQIFGEEQYREIWEILRPDQINVLDLSVIAQGRYGLRNLVVAVLANFIFRMRTIARRREALDLPTDTQKIWLVIDEAHNFSPSGKSTLSKEILVRWAKEGRQPGLSLVVASQQPAAIDSEILTQCGIRVVHRITSKDDIHAVNALSQEYVSGGLATRITGLKGPGDTLVIDDKHETVVHTKVRPRQSLHGGGGA
jgi:uncharacterized protein